MSRNEVLVDSKGETVCSLWLARFLARIAPDSFGDEPKRTQEALDIRASQSDDYEDDKKRWKRLRRKTNKTPEDIALLESYEGDFRA